MREQIMHETLGRRIVSVTVSRRVTGTEAWKQWLMENDTRVRARGIIFAEKITKELLNRSYFEPQDLEGVCLDKESFELNEMERGVIARAQITIEKITNTMEKDNFAKLAELLADNRERDRKDKEREEKEKEKDKVHLEIGKELARATMTGLDAELWPKTTAVDALAAELHKQRKKGVRFVFLT